MKNFSTTLLRIILGIIFISHGVARLVHWSVPEFGAFLDSKGLIFGGVLAWVITIGELIAGSLMALGHRVKLCVIFHAVVVLPGIFLVHLPEGWFVVGHGRNGVEYSILILAALTVVYNRPGKRFKV